MQTSKALVPSLNATLMELPIMKHFNESDIVTNTNTLKKGEKGIFNFLKFMVIIGAIFGTVVYVLPPVFQAIGRMLAVAVTGVITVFLVLIAPLIFRLLRRFAKKLHKAVIASAPFEQFEIERKKLLDLQQTFRAAKGNILTLKSDMEVEAANSEKDANSYQTKILTLQNKVHTLKEHLDNLGKSGVEARNSDEYVNGQAELLKLLSESNRVATRMTQAKDFVQKYGSRAAIMKKLNQNMVMAETSIEIKIEDFDATVEMLKADTKFSQKARAATDAAKSVMLFDKGWELEFAIEVVHDTIANDIATTAGNIKDLEMLTRNYNVDSDELYANLNLLADNIKIGKDPVQSAKQYSNPEYKLTSSDKLKSGGFDNLFD